MNDVLTKAQYDANAAKTDWNQIRQDDNRSNRYVIESHMQNMSLIGITDPRQQVLAEVMNTAGAAIFENGGELKSQPHLAGYHNTIANQDTNHQVTSAYERFTESFRRNPQEVQTAAAQFHLELQSMGLRNNELTYDRGDGNLQNSYIQSQIETDDRKATFAIGTAMLDILGKKAGVLHNDIIEEAMNMAANAIKERNGLGALPLNPDATSIAANQFIDQETLDAFRTFAKEVKHIGSGNDAKAQQALDKFAASLAENNRSSGFER